MSCHKSHKTVPVWPRLLFREKHLWRGHIKPGADYSNFGLKQYFPTLNRGCMLEVRI